IWAVATISEKISARAKKISILYFTLFTMLTGIFTAQYNVTNDAVNSQMELSFLRAGVNAHKNEKLMAIHVIRPAGILSFTGLPVRYDEFNFCSSNSIHDIKMMVQTFLKSKDSRGNGIIITENFPAVTNSYPDSPFIYTQEGSIIINMNDLRLPGKKRILASVTSEIVKIKASGASSGYQYSGVCAFDKQNKFKGTFWETAGYPQWLEIEYKKARQITGYILQASNIPERMPGAWLFQYSDDRMNWVTIESRKNEINWKEQEKRSWEVKNPSNHRFYRWIFTEGNDNILRIEEIKILYKNE
ncbi:MAG: discoidin domain-containing protein, partial [Candidatus Eremiobacterota bacterium]